MFHNLKNIKSDDLKHFTQKETVFIRTKCAEFETSKRNALGFDVFNLSSDSINIDVNLYKHSDFFVVQTNMTNFEVQCTKEESLEKACHTGILYLKNEYTMEPITFLDIPEYTYSKNEGVKVRRPSIFHYQTFDIGAITGFKYDKDITSPKIVPWFEVKLWNKHKSYEIVYDTKKYYRLFKGIQGDVVNNYPLGLTTIDKKLIDISVKEYVEEINPTA